MAFSSNQPVTPKDKQHNNRDNNLAVAIPRLYIIYWKKPSNYMLNQKGSTLILTQWNPLVHDHIFLPLRCFDCEIGSRVCLLRLNNQLCGLSLANIPGYNKSAEWKSTNCSHVFTDVSFLGLVEVIPWSLSRFLNVSRGWLPLHGPGDLHYFGQIPALNDCVYRYMYQSRYVALHDMDELILTQSVKR